MAAKIRVSPLKGQVLDTAQHVKRLSSANTVDTDKSATPPNHRFTSL